MYATEGVADHCAVFACFSSDNSDTKRGFGVRSAPAVFASHDPKIQHILENVVSRFFQHNQHLYHPHHKKPRNPAEAIDSFKHFLTVELSKEKQLLSNSDCNLLAHHQQVIALLQLEPSVLETKHINPILQTEMENFKHSISKFSKTQHNSFRKWLDSNWNKPTHAMWKRIKGTKAPTLITQMEYINPSTKEKSIASKPEEVANVLGSRLEYTFRKVPVHRQNWLTHIHLLPTTTETHQNTLFEFTNEDVIYGFMRNGSHRAAGGDGIPVILWKRLVTFPEVVNLVRKSWNFMAEPTGRCPKSHKACITSMLWKCKGKRKDAGMYRPITLSCVDYRALHKALGYKISKEIEQIVGPTQFAFIKGRTIHSVGHALQILQLCF